MKRVFLFSAVLFCCVKFARSQQSSLDLSFGKNGIVKTDLGAKMEYSSAAKQVLTQSDGSVYVIFEAAGVTQITKKKPNGTTDSTYGINGYSVSVRISGVHAALQTDGKIVIAGTFFTLNPQNQDESNDVFNDFGIARFNTDGTLDKTFADNGLQHTDFNSYGDAAGAIVIQSDGKIVVSGNTEVTHDDEDNSSDTYNIAVARYNADGSLDDTFDGDGQLTLGDNFLSPLSNQNWVTVAANGKIVLTDFFDDGFDRYLKATRLNSNGSTDNTFSLNINLTNNDGSYFAVKSSVVQNDGKIVIGGLIEFSQYDYNFELERFNLNGTPDFTFGYHGRQTTDFRGYNDYLNTLAIQSDGKIVAAGSASNGSNNAFAIARYKTNGTLDNTFDGDGKRMNFIGSYDVTAVAVAISNTGKIVAAGYNQAASGTYVAIAEYNSNGSLDNTFHGTGAFIDHFTQGNTIFNSLVVQADGKIVVAGHTSNGTNNDFVVARYKTNGSLDSTFSGDGIATVDFGAEDNGNAVTIQNDGKIVVAGSANNGSNTDFAVARFNADGSVDDTFGYNGKLTTDFGGDESATFVTVQSNGKITAAGGQSIARYNTNGFPDVSLNGTGKLVTNYSFNDFALQSDGKIVAAGTTYDEDTYISVFLVERYNSNGSIDNSFGNNGVQTTNFFPDYDPESEEDFYPYVNVTSIRIQPDGKIIAAGSASLSGRHGFEHTDVALARYNADGSADNTFSDDGMETIGFGHLSNNPSIAFRDSGKIVLKAKLFDNVYYNGYGFDAFTNVDAGYAFASLNTNGSLDATFAAGGIQYAATGDEIQNIAVSGNYLYAAGYTQTEGKTGFLSRYLLHINKAPIVSITSPAGNTIYNAPATITITAKATDTDGTISSVKFYIGSAYLATDKSAPYTYTLSNLAAGTYYITARATDNSGAQTTSAPVKVIVNKAPIVSITSPANNASFKAPATITVNATATDDDGTISNVKFYIGSTYLKTDVTSPYSCTISNLQAGTYALTAKATDNNGLQTTSVPVTIKISNNAIVSSRPYSETEKTASNDALRLRLSPNPATNIVNIQTGGLQANQPATLSIISTSGNVLKTMQISNTSTQLDVSSLASGVYTLKIVSGDKVMYKQFVKL